MPTMQEVRAKFPQYNDMSDDQLAAALHRKFYSDMPFNDFAAKVGLTASQPMAGADAEISAALPDTRIPRNLSWSEVGSQALQNTPASAKQFGMDIWNAVSDPIGSVDTTLDLAAGGISRGLEYVTGADMFPENKATATADAVGKFYKDRYGSVEGFKNAVATDPVGVLGDAATILSGGEAAAVRALGPASRVAKTLGTTSRVLNPLTVPEKAIKATGKVAGGIAKTALGATTGTSSKTIQEAYMAGREGGEASAVFRNNLRRTAGQTDAVDDAKKALGNIAAERDKEIRADMRAVKADTSPIDMAPIEQAFQDLVDGMFYEGHAAVSDNTLAVVKKIGETIDEWSKDPKLQNAFGFHILKTKIDDLMPAFGDGNKTKKAERAVTEMRNKVKDAIVAKFPAYAEAMKKYEKSIKAQQEIEKSLSLGKKNTADQSLRKLQSVTRDNVNTNYGERANMAEQLAAAGAPNLMPALAGQALGTWLPRGMLKPIMAGGGALGAYANPAFWAGVPFFSPRLVGEATRATGVLARGLDAIPKPTKEQLLLLRQLGIVGSLEPPSQ